jgi:hypothetical protein
MIDVTGNPWRLNNVPVYILHRKLTGRRVPARHNGRPIISTVASLGRFAMSRFAACLISLGLVVSAAADDKTGLHIQVCRRAGR